MRHLLAQRRLVVLLCAVALLVKLLVPTGYMIVADHGRIAVALCPAAVPSPMPAMHGDMAGHHRPVDHDKPEQPCAFAGLSAASLGAVDPILLAALVAFVVAIGLAAVAPPAARRVRQLRPPPRGPPVAA